MHVLFLQVNQTLSFRRGRTLTSKSPVSICGENSQHNLLIFCHINISGKCLHLGKYSFALTLQLIYLFLFVTSECDLR